jgi:hypothetical protein
MRIPRTELADHPQGKEERRSLLRTNAFCLLRP